MNNIFLARLHWTITKILQQWNKRQKEDRITNTGHTLQAPLQTILWNRCQLHGATSGISKCSKPLVTMQPLKLRVAESDYVIFGKGQPYILYNIHNARFARISDQTVRNNLREAGWSASSCCHFLTAQNCQQRQQWCQLHNHLSLTSSEGQENLNL